MVKFTLAKSETGLLIVDMQEKIFSAMDQQDKLLPSILKLIQGFQIFQIPIFISEQYPQGLGESLPSIKSLLGTTYHPWTKTTFSCVDDQAFSQYVQSLPIKQWVVVGIEAHICVLQTAKGLIRLGKDVTVLRDAISSKCPIDLFSAISEMQQQGIRISSVETVLFELLHDAHASESKAIIQLIKTNGQNIQC